MSNDRSVALSGGGRLIAAVLVVALAAAAFLVLSGTAEAASSGKSKNEKTHISGNSTPSDCNDGKGAGALLLTGDLEGCLTFFPKRFTCDELNGFAKYTEWGREKFQGTLNGKSGKFRTKYKVVATYKQGSCQAFNDGGFPFEGQITGGCKHKVIGKTGAFRGYKGLITFYDEIPVVGEGATNFLYDGYVKPKNR
ncbi:MAG: hypothetical protein ACR2OD_01340 [Gaiellaceae bacterium]